MKQFQIKKLNNTLVYSHLPNVFQRFKQLKTRTVQGHRVANYAYDVVSIGETVRNINQYSDLAIISVAIKQAA